MTDPTILNPGTLEVTTPEVYDPLSEAARLSAELIAGQQAIKEQCAAYAARAMQVIYWFQLAEEAALQQFRDRGFTDEQVDSVCDEILGIVGKLSGWLEANGVLHDLSRILDPDRIYEQAQAEVKATRRALDGVECLDEPVPEDPGPAVGPHDFGGDR